MLVGYEGIVGVLLIGGWLPNEYRPLYSCGVVRPVCFASVVQTQSLMIFAILCCTAGSWPLYSAATTVFETPTVLVGAAMLSNI